MKTLSDAEIQFQDTVRDALRPKPDGKMLSFVNSAAPAAGPQARQQQREIETQLSAVLAKAIPDHPAMDGARREAIMHLAAFRPEPQNARAVAFGLNRKGQERPLFTAEAPPGMRNGRPAFDARHKRHWPELSALAGDLKTYVQAAGKTGSAKFPPVERLGLRDGRGEGLVAYASAGPAKAPHKAGPLAATTLGRINERLDRLAPPGPGFDSLRQHIVDTVWSSREALAEWGKIEQANKTQLQTLRADNPVQSPSQAPFLPNRMHYPMAEAWHGINRRQHLENEGLSVPAGALMPDDALRASVLIRSHAALHGAGKAEGDGVANRKSITEGVLRQTAARADTHAGHKGEIAAAMNKIMPAKPGNHAERAAFVQTVFENRQHIGRLGNEVDRQGSTIMPPDISVHMHKHAGTMATLALSLERLHASIEGRQPLKREPGAVMEDKATGTTAAEPARKTAKSGKKRQIEGQGTLAGFFKRPAPEKPAAARGLDERPQGPDRTR
jgi:hypothetical protein